MAQQTQQWRSGTGEMAWLSMLVDTMEKLSEPEFRGILDDPAILVAVKSQLASPVLQRGFYGSNFSLLN